MSAAPARSRAVTALLVAPAAVFFVFLLIVPLMVVLVFSFGERAPAGGYQPAFTFDTAEGPRLQPCAEVCLTERAIGAVLARGIMPLVSVKGTDAVRFVRLQSIADPPTALLTNR